MKSTNILQIVKNKIQKEQRIKNAQKVHLSQCGWMKFIVDDIEFDFVDSGGELPYDEQVALVKDVLGAWEADDEDDLIDEVTEEQFMKQQQEEVWWWIALKCSRQGNN